MSETKSKLSLKSIASLILVAGGYFVLQHFGLIPEDESGTAKQEQSGGTAVAEPKSSNKTSSKAAKEQNQAPTSAPKQAPAKKADDKETAKKDDGTALVRQCFKAMRSDVIVEFDATVKVLLRDDNEGSRHQKFLLDLGQDLTVLVAHNIDLAPRAPVEKGDRIRVRGEYEYTDKGGVVHWTHHDPKGWHDDGWIEVDGKRYQ